MDKLRAMQTFIHIAEQGSLTAAARVMASSLPATVRTLAALESHLGVRLFNRTTRRISLTEEGRRHLESCRQLLAALGDAEAALTQEAGEPAGQLSITAPMLFGQMHVAPAVTRSIHACRSSSNAVSPWTPTVPPSTPRSGSCTARSGA